MHRSLYCLLFCLLFVTSAIGQHHGTEPTKTNIAVDLGKIDFPNSGPSEAQKAFIEGVLLLHSFEYGRARVSFREAARIAPGFALAYWGEAMTHDHRIWGEQDQKAGLAALGRLAATAAERRAKATTEREKMYIDAVERLYGDGTQEEVAAGYSKAMEALSQKFPDDLEARSFYSLSILGLTGTVRNTENYMRAAGIAEEIYQKNPLHPGALHYLIHSYDDPTHAPLGLRAARVYGSVARSASHAQHMPSHIFFALGMWEDSITANAASMKTARDQGSGGYHPLHWLIHAYYQVGRDKEAEKLLAVIEEDSKTNTSANNRSHLAMSRATILVESRGKGPASIMTPVETTGIRSYGTFSNHDLAIGLEHVRRDQLADAKRILESMRARNSAGTKKGEAENDISSRYTTVSKADIDSGKVMDQILDSAIKFAEGSREEALAIAKAAAEGEDTLVFEYGPPAIVKPAWESAGELYLAAGRKAEAAQAFRNALKRYPNRKISNEGLAAALK